MKGGQTGSATVENIIWLPVLLMMIGAIVQFGLYFNARNTVQAAAYEAARQAATAAEPRTAAEETAFGFAEGIVPGWTKGQRVEVAIEAPIEPHPGESISVEISYRVPVFFARMLPGFKEEGGTVKVRGIAKTVIEEKP